MFDISGGSMDDHQNLGRTNPGCNYSNDGALRGAAARNLGGLFPHTREELLRGSHWAILVSVGHNGHHQRDQSRKCGRDR